MEVTGTLKTKNPEQKVSDKFTKREFVVTTEDQYPQTILMQLTQDRCSFLDRHEVGDTVKCHINLRGREWTNPQGEVKVFNTIDCWKIESMSTSRPVQNTAAAASTPADDLPF